MKYKYNIGDVVLLKNTILGKVGIIIGTTPQPGTYVRTYVILICGEPKEMTYWEDEIIEKI
jgi:hypothetical protein